jgi:hypothetical protein
MKMETKTTRVICPHCQKDFGINGGLNMAWMKAKNPSPKPLESGDFTVCTGCYTVLRLHPEVGWREVLEMEWLDLDLDTRTFLKQAQKMLKNRREPDAGKRRKGSISQQQLDGEDEPSNEQERVALMTIAMKITLGVLNKMESDDHLHSAGTKGLIELAEMAKAGHDNFDDKVRILVASSLALCAMTDGGSLESAKKDIEHGLKDAEKDALAAGVMVVNMSEGLPNEES